MITQKITTTTKAVEPLASPSDILESAEKDTNLDWQDEGKIALGIGAWQRLKELREHNLPLWQPRRSVDVPIPVRQQWFRSSVQPKSTPRQRSEAQVCLIPSCEPVTPAHKPVEKH